MNYCLSPILLLLGAPAFAQDAPTVEPPKGANTVLIATADSVGPAWRHIRETLLAQGYSLAQSDAEVHSFSTSPKVVKAGRALTISGFVKQAGAGEAVISLSGSYRLTTNTMHGQYETARQATWQGGGRGNDKAMFTQVEQVAKAYPSQSKPVSYTTR